MSITAHILVGLIVTMTAIAVAVTTQEVVTRLDERRDRRRELRQQARVIALLAQLRDRDTPRRDRDPVDHRVDEWRTTLWTGDELR